MSHTRANLLMLLASFIWGTAFVSQTTGMGAIGPFTFSFARFFFALLTVLPLAIYFERHNIKKIFSNNKLLLLCCATGFALFVGMGLQQYALQKSQISNAAFLSTLYVPFVGIISPALSEEGGFGVNGIFSWHASILPLSSSISIGSCDS